MISTLSRASAATTVLTALLLVTGCDQLEQLGVPNPFESGGLDPAVTEAIDRGDLPAVESALKGKAPADLDPEEAKYLAFVQLSKGDYAAADATLAAVEEAASDEERPAIKLRRALVAMRAGRIEDVRTHALSSGLPEGKVLAAEVNIVGLDANAARALLQEVQGHPGPVGQTATRYLELLDGGPDYEAVADLTALWALGDRARSCEQAVEIIQSVPDEDKKAELQLLWAGRAVSSGHPKVATALLDELTQMPSPDQAWRVQAVRAMAMVAQGEGDAGAELFENLREAGAPADGLEDAIATAIALTDQREVAVRLAGDMESNAIARGLWHAGFKEEALRHAPADSSLRKIME